MQEKSHLHAPKFAVGDQVWLAAKNIKVHQASQKLGPRQLGPFTIVQVRDNDDYELDLPPVLKIHPVFHVNRLSKYTETDENGKPPPPPPIEVDGEEEWEIERILDSRFYRRQFQYLIRWKGFDEGHDSWEPAKNITHADEAIAEFHRKNPNAPRKISANGFSKIEWRPLENHTEQQPSDLEWEAGRYRSTSVSRTTRV